MHFNGAPSACMPGLVLRSKFTSPHRGQPFAGTRAQVREGSELMARGRGVVVVYLVCYQLLINMADMP